MMPPVRWDFYTPTPVEETEKDVLKIAFHMYLVPFEYSSSLRKAVNKEAFQIDSKTCITYAGLIRVHEQDLPSCQTFAYASM